MGPRILCVLPQMPQDPASGAARSVQTAFEMARDGGFEVRAIGTTATERGLKQDPIQFLRSSGIEPEVSSAALAGYRELQFEQRGIHYTLLDTGRFPVAGWQKTHGRQFDRLFDRELEAFAPDIIFTYGGEPGDVSRQKRARRKGAVIAFKIGNLGYLQPRFFDHIDAVMTPSNFLANKYREAIGIHSTALPPPLDMEDVVSPAHDPIFMTMVNPALEKGLFFFARLAEELGRLQPKIAVLAIESRGTAGLLVAAGMRGGFDLRRHESIMVAGAVPRPRDIYENARVLLAPSVVEEAAGRVVPEALVNGVVPLVSDRGGLAETCNGAGFVLPLPKEYTVKDTVPVAAEAVRPWTDVIERLAFDEPFYQEEVRKARMAAAMYSRENLTPRYVDFFRQALANAR
ncbi:MAG: glycosyltransferase [Acidobacteria bacterium]|nr:glycosyltransferase [Acidobacteriota bacterium]